jgi:ADP-ribose pyrophosphatase YjhB (NUDIX family)
VGELDEWKHCPRCAAEIEVDQGQAECAACGFRGYASSKPTASALCVDVDGRIMLSRRAGDPFAGYWDLPGGFLNEAEHPLDGIRRELQEETGAVIEPADYLGVWVDHYSEDKSGPATLNFYWTAHIVEGEPEPADDVAELRWFAADEIPYDELAFRHLPEVISAWQQHA